MTNKIVTDDVLSGVISKVKGALSNKSDAGHTHDQYVTDEEMLEELDSIKNVGRNLLKNSDVTITNPKYPMTEYEITQNIPEGTEVTVSLKGTLGEGKEGFSLYNSGGTVEITTLYRNSFNSDGVAVKTFNWRVAGASNDKLRIYPILGSVTAESTIEWIKLEYGNKQTSYIKAPEDAVDSAKKLETARKITLSGAVTGESIMFDGTSNVDYHISTLKSEYLRDTVPNAKNGVFPLEAKSYDVTRACRTAFLPADQIYVEYTRDNGNTWKEYPLSDERKQGLFSMNRGTYLSIGGTDLTNDPTNVKRSIGNATRVTIVPWKSDGTAERYTSFDTFYAWFSAGGDRINVKIERSTIGAKDTFETVYENDAMKFSGWSDAGNIKIPYGTFGGSNTQTANHYAYRITFKTALNDDSTNLTNTSNTQTVTDLRFYGEKVWTTPNNMMNQDHIYTWDVDGTVDFPKHVRATGNLSEGGQWLTDKYAPKSHTHDEYVTDAEMEEAIANAQLGGNTDDTSGGVVTNNLFDINSNENIEGYYLGEGGAHVSYSTWAISHYIPVEQNTKYIKTGQTAREYDICFYDTEKRVIERITFESVIGGIFITPEDTAYMRFDYALDDFGNVDDGREHLGIYKFSSSKAVYSEPHNMYYNSTEKQRNYDGVTCVWNVGKTFVLNGTGTADNNDFTSPNNEIHLVVGQEYEIQFKHVAGSCSFTPDEVGYFKLEAWDSDVKMLFHFRVYDFEDFVKPFVFTARSDNFYAYAFDNPEGAVFNNLVLEVVLRERPYVRTGVDADEMTVSKLKIGNYVLSHNNINDTLDISYGG